MMSTCNECKFRLEDKSCDKGRNNKYHIFSCEDFSVRTKNVTDKIAKVKVIIHTFDVNGNEIEKHGLGLDFYFPKNKYEKI